jgi:hypothetical protein
MTRDGHELLRSAAGEGTRDVEARFCPLCGAALETPQGFVHEYWVATDRNFHCWCPVCFMVCTVVVSPRVTSHEPEH